MAVEGIDRHSVTTKTFTRENTTRKKDALKKIPPPCRGRGTTKWWKGCSGANDTFLVLQNIAHKSKGRCVNALPPLTKGRHADSAAPLCYYPVAERLSNRATIKR